VPNNVKHKAMMANGQKSSKRVALMNGWIVVIKNVTVETNSRMLGFLHQDGVAMVSKTLKSENSTIIAPCFIDDDVVLINATVGPMYL
jgi:glucose-1-phosphate thymidylyltransferase